MARARNIKPGFFKNECLAECSVEARLLFIGLWTLADREGRLEDRPKRFRAEIFPYDGTDCEPLLAELVEQNLLLRYQVDEKKYILIPKFTAHQNPHGNEKQSEIPEPQQNSSNGSKYSEKGRKLPQSNPAESLLLNPESSSLNPESGNLKTDNRSKNRKYVCYPDEFETFWKLYPKNDQGRKPGKEAAHAEWKKVSASDQEELLTATRHYASGCSGFPKHAERFLKKNFWRDFVEPPELEPIKGHVSQLATLAKLEGLPDE